MIKIKKLALVLLVILAVICGGTGMYALQSSGIIAVNGSGVHKLNDYEYSRYQQYLKDYSKLDELKRYVQTYYYEKPEEDLLYEGIYKGLFAILGDPYSSYMTKEEYEEEEVSASGKYSGIGATLTMNENNHVEIISLVEGSPSEKSGLRKGDEILEVDGVVFTGEELDKCASSIRGPKGSTVKLHILRGGNPMDFEIVRDNIVNISVKSHMINDKLGYIQITGFEDPTADLFRAALSSIEESGAESFILDMRDNGGGYVDVALEIADLLMEKGTVVYVEDQNGKREYYKTNAGRTKLSYVVLVNEASASATEILTAGIMDNHEADVVGTKTYGKGIIQNVQPLSDGTAVKLTVLQYYSPSGRKIHKEGIVPNYVVEIPKECYDEEGELISDPQLDKAKELLGF